MALGGRPILGNKSYTLRSVTPLKTTLSEILLTHPCSLKWLAYSAMQIPAAAVADKVLAFLVSRDRAEARFCGTV